MRAYLVAAGVFAVLAGTLLALGAGHTETRFAWTIRSELTTAFLNGMYWAAAVLLLVSARERRWASARFGAYAAALFMTLLLVVMLVHFDLLHTDDRRFLVSWGAWGFLTSYAVLPALGVAAITHQLRRRVRSVAAAYAAIALLQASALVRFGDEVGWSRPAAWVYVAVLASLAGVAVAGAARWRGRRQRASGRSAAHSV